MTVVFIITFHFPVVHHVVIYCFRFFMPQRYKEFPTFLHYLIKIPQKLFFSYFHFTPSLS